MKARIALVALPIVALLATLFVIASAESAGSDGTPTVEVTKATSTTAQTTTTAAPTTTVPPTTTTTEPPPPPLAPDCSTWGNQDEAQAWMDANGPAHDTSNIDTDGDGRPCTAHFAPPPTTVAPQASPQASPSGNCALPGYICQRESGFNPQAVNPTGCSGRGCYGKYQFDPRTWDSVVRQMGRNDLVGNYMPDEGTQDAVASHLWAGGAGCSHWAACS